MNSLFLDLEMNQPSNRIIQLSAVKFNLKSGEELASFDSYVNPGEILDPFIIELTGIQQHVVATAPPLQTVLKDFWAWVEAQCVGGKIVAWGDDVWLLKLVSTELGVSYPNVRELNLKVMAGWFKSAKGLPEKGGLKTAMQQFGLQFEGVPHNALHDARNTGRLGVALYRLITIAHKMQQLAEGLK